jgi:hypothetical protein
MKHISTYQLFESEKPVVTFDFDGVLHKSVIGAHPTSFTEPELWEPFEKVEEIMRREAKDHRIIIVTARDEWNKPYILQYIKSRKLPVEQVICTDNDPKLEYLKDVGSIRHYDDRDMTEELKGSGIQFIRVHPKDDKIEEDQFHALPVRWLDIPEAELEKKIKYWESVMNQAPLKYKYAIGVLASVKHQKKISQKQKEILDQAMENYPSSRDWGTKRY